AIRLPMSRIAGRNPKASGHTMTPGCVPVVGRMYAASQVPSGVFTSTIVSVTGISAADAEPAAAAILAATDIVTNSRRERSAEDSGLSSDMVISLFDFDLEL